MKKSLLVPMAILAVLCGSLSLMTSCKSEEESKNDKAVAAVKAVVEKDYKQIAEFLKTEAEIPEMEAVFVKQTPLPSYLFNVGTRVGLENAVKTRNKIQAGIVRYSFYSTRAINAEDSAEFEAETHSLLSKLQSVKTEINDSTPIVVIMKFPKKKVDGSDGSTYGLYTVDPNDPSKVLGKLDMDNENTKLVAIAASAKNDNLYRFSMKPEYLDSLAGVAKDTLESAIIRYFR